MKIGIKWLFVLSTCMYTAILVITYIFVAKGVIDDVYKLVTLLSTYLIIIGCNTLIVKYYYGLAQKIMK